MIIFKYKVNNNWEIWTLSLINEMLAWISILK